MTDDTLARLRAINPVTDDTAAPPITRIHALIAAQGAPGAPPRPRRRRRWTGALLPALGTAVALAVAVLALITVGHGVRSHHRSPAGHRHHPPTTRGPAPAARVALPRGGMPGVVQLWGAAMSSAGAGIVSFEQCNPCDTTQAFAEWSVTTGDAGAHWLVQRRPFYLFAPQFGGVGDVWSDGQNRGAVVNGVWVSHDGGMNFTRAKLGALSNEPGDAAAAGGEAWATAPECGATCRTTILHGPAAGSTLVPTVRQPVPRARLTQIVAAGRGSAYLEVGQFRTARHYVTHDDGRSWQPTATGCRSASLDEALVADGPASLWEQCPVGHGRFAIARSTDSGHRWALRPLPFGGLLHLQPAGGGTAWAVTDAGLVIRTEDGGAHWRAVLRTGGSLLVGSAQTAVVVTTAGRGHVHHHAADTNLIAYRTSDGGVHWQATAVPLPGR